MSEFFLIAFLALFSGLFACAEPSTVSDEEKEAIMCDVGEFLCHDQETCIPKAWLCDGEPDCPDDSDESDQTCAQEVTIRCPLNHIQCIGTNKCIHFNKLCNGARDCEDGYDEGVHCRGDCGRWSPQSLREK